MGYALWKKIEIFKNSEMLFWCNGIPCDIIHIVIAHFIVIEINFLVSKNTCHNAAQCMILGKWIFLGKVINQIKGHIIITQLSCFCAVLMLFTCFIAVIRKVGISSV